MNIKLQQAYKHKNSSQSHKEVPTRLKKLVLWTKNLKKNITIVPKIMKKNKREMEKLNLGGNPFNLIQGMFLNLNFA